MTYGGKLLKGSSSPVLDTRPLKINKLVAGDVSLSMEGKSSTMGRLYYVIPSRRIMFGLTCRNAMERFKIESMPRITHLELNADMPESLGAFYKNVFGWMVQKKETGKEDYWFLFSGPSGARPASMQE